jgi:hypothetical protein
MLEEVRLETIFVVASFSSPGEDCASILAPLEPFVPFTKEWLEFRSSCYALRDDARLVEAWDDLKRFESRGTEPLLPPEE